MTHVLDRPIWTALNSRHAGLAEGGALAKRYPAAVSAFAAAGDERRRASPRSARSQRPARA